MPLHHSLSSRFGAVTLIANLLLAPLLHGDAIRAVDLVATSLVFLGVATCLYNSAAASEARNYAELLALAVRPAFLAWLGGLAQQRMASMHARLR